MASSMKMMNMVMPVFSAWFCFTLPSGMGLYWIASAVVRTILMIIINKQLDKMSFDDIIKKNSVKSAKKLEKIHKQQEILNTYANMNTISFILINCVTADKTGIMIAPINKPQALSL